MRTSHLIFPLALALLAPTAAASGLELSLAEHETPEPPGERFAMSFVARVPCDAVSESGTVSFAVTRAPEWATATARPESASLSSRDCVGTHHEVEGTVTIALALDAPALAPEAIHLVARVAGEAPLETYDERLVQVAFAPRVEVRALQTSRMGKPQSTLDFPIEVTNLGNGNTKVTFEVSADHGFRAMSPQPITMESAATGGTVTKQTLSVSVSTPYQNGGNRASTTILVRYVPSYALDPELRGPPGEITLFAASEGMYVPAPALPALAAGALVAAILRASIHRGSRREPKG